MVAPGLADGAAPDSTGQPSFGSEEYIRIGSLTKKLKEYTEKERELWATFARKPFEIGIAKADVDGPDVLKLLDFDRCFKLLPPFRPTSKVSWASWRTSR